MKQIQLHTNQVFQKGGEQELAACQDAILKALAYFDIFHYPLVPEEICTYMGIIADPQVFDKALDSLVEESCIFLHHGFYSLQNNPLLAHRRVQGNKRAEKMLTRAIKIGRFLYQFPFVRGIGISGSLSKNFAEEKSDIDFFIITSPNRLWIGRTLMQVLTKLALLRGRQHFYCMNYYIDEHALQLPEKNIFTAIELKTLLPVAGENTMQRFFQTNIWANTLLPGCHFRAQQLPNPSSSWIKRAGEWIFGARIFNSLERYLFQSTTRRWQRKERKGLRNDKGHVLNLLTGKHFARTNPDAFQEKVLAIYEEKLAALRESRYPGKLNVSSAT